jgi:hypothetical protein
VIDTSTSRLKSRREADVILAALNDADHGQRKNGSLLIYVPVPRHGALEDRVQDPFELFALVGSGFGDKDAERIQSLARQALPERIAEIDRLFVEGRPTVAMIEALGQGQRHPLLEEALGTDSILEATALLLCRNGMIAKVMPAANASSPSATGCAVPTTPARATSPWLAGWSRNSGCRRCSPSRRCWAGATPSLSRSAATSRAFRR